MSSSSSLSAGKSQSFCIPPDLILCFREVLYHSVRSLTLPQRPFALRSPLPTLPSVILALALGCSGQSHHKEPDCLRPAAGTLCFSPRVPFTMWSQVSEQAWGPV